MILAAVFPSLRELLSPRFADKYEFVAVLFLLVRGLHHPALANSLFERVESRLNSLLQRRWLAALILISLPVLLRILLLPTQPVPQPRVHDEFSNLLVADTLVHGRLANPTHRHYNHFETIYVLQQPSYSSIYPVGAGANACVRDRNCLGIRGREWFSLAVSCAQVSTGCCSSG